MQEVTLLSNVFIFKYYKPFLGEMLFFFSFARAEMCYIAVWCSAAAPECRNIAQLFFRQKLKVGLKIHSESSTKCRNTAYFQNSCPDRK